jgi:hypothetical protein
VPSGNVAVTEYNANEVVAVGVPDITPVEEFILRPVGKDGEIVYVGVPVPDKEFVSETVEVVKAELTAKKPFCITE